jgi:hypothetical protein
MGGTAAGSTLSDIAAPLHLAGGGQAGDRVRLESAVAVDIRVDSDGAGSSLITGIPGSIDFAGFASLDLLLGAGNDIVALHDTGSTHTTVETGAGADMVEVFETTTGTALDLLLGTGADTVTVFGNDATLTISDADEGNFADQLRIDRSLVASPLTGALAGDSGGGEIAGLTGGAIRFSDIEQLSMLLGGGNDVLSFDHQLDGTAIDVDGGGGDDLFTVRSISRIDATSIAGNSGEDTVTVRLDTPPIEDGQFRRLTLGVEQLIVDNSRNLTQGVAWTVTDGASIEADSGSGKLLVVNSEGAQHVRIEGGTQSDTLDVVSSIGSDVQGAVDGNRVELSAGAVVLTPVAAQTLADVGRAIDFDGLLSGAVARYWEDGFSMASLTGGEVVTLDDAVSPAARGSSTATAFSLVRDADNNGVADGVFSLYAIDLASTTSAAQTVVFSGVTANGRTVFASFDAPGTDPATGKPVFQRFTFDAGDFAALTQVTWTGGTAVMDNISVAAADYFGAAPATTSSVAQATLSGNLVFDTSSNWIVVDTNNDRTLNTGETIYWSNGSIYTLTASGFVIGSASPAPFSTSSAGGVTTFSFAGNLTVSNNARISGVGINGLSVTVANNVVIGSNAILNFSASGTTAGAGGGTFGGGGGGGSNGLGGGGGNGGTTAGTTSNGGGGGSGDDGGSAGVAGGSNGVAGASGGPGGPGTAGTSGLAGGAGGAGVNNPNGGAASTGQAVNNGAAVTGGSAGGAGSRGGGGSAGGILNGDNGGPGGGGGSDGSARDITSSTLDGRNGNGGTVGRNGNAGSNAVSGLTISGGGGGSGGQGGGGGGGGSGGGGGGSGGGGGGGGSAGYPVPFYAIGLAGGDGGAGGHGGDGGSGGNGSVGTAGGAGGAGGGAFELVARGTITFQSGAAVSARGGRRGGGCQPGCWKYLWHQEHRPHHWRWWRWRRNQRLCRRRQRRQGWRRRLRRRWRCRRYRWQGRHRWWWCRRHDQALWHGAVRIPGQCQLCRGHWKRCRRSRPTDSGLQHQPEWQ